LNKPSHTIREATEQDLPGISDLLTRCDFGPKKPEWLRWKYLDNPDGAARIFIVQTPDKRVGGLLAYTPREYRNGTASSLIIMQAVDGILAPELRGKKIYSELLQYAMSKISAPVIGFPNKRTEHIHVKHGWKRLSPEQRWYFPVAGGRAFPNAPRPVNVFFNLISARYAILLLGRMRHGIAMKLIERFDKEFDIRYNSVQSAKSASFLNWRFIDNPVRKYFPYEFFESGKSIGYCVYALDKASAEVFDFVVRHRERACFRLLIEHLRKRRISHLVYRGTSLNLWRYGFVPCGSTGHYIGLNLPCDLSVITLADSDW
jgi:hypothetical protein